MDGSAFPGRPPVFPSRDIQSNFVQTTRGPVAKLEAREDAYDGAVSDAVAEVVERDLRGHAESLSAVYDTCGKDGKPVDQLLRDLSADNLDDWLRLLALCPVADQETVALNMQDWLLATMHSQPWAVAAAERVAARRLKL